MTAKRSIDETLAVDVAGDRDPTAIGTTSVMGDDVSKKLMAGEFQAFEYGCLIHQDAVASQDRVVAAHAMGHERADSAYRAHCRLVVLRNRSAFCHVADDE